MTCKLWSILAVPLLWTQFPTFRDRKKMMSFLYKDNNDAEWQLRKTKNRTGEKRKPLILKDKADKVRRAR
jgi:hypothetical protein